MNRFKRGIGALILIGGLIAFLPSCKTERPVVFHNLKPLSFDTLYYKMQANEARFSSLNAKIGISYKKNDHSVVSFRAQVRIRKDSLIWVSIMPAMGIEVARAELTPDSLKLLERMKKRYILGNYHLLDSLLHSSVNYTLIQSLLLGNNLSGHHLSNSNAGADREGYLLSFQREGNTMGNSMKSENIPVKLMEKIWLYPTDFKIRKLYVRQQTDHKTKELLVYYDHYQNVQGQLLPAKMRIVLNSRPKTEIFLTFKKVELNKKYGVPFYIPEDYKKLF